MRFSKVVSVVISLAGLAIFATPACSSDSPSTPRVSLSSFLGAGNQKGINDSTICKLASKSTWILIGDPTTTTSVFDGDKDSATGNTVNVTCSVIAAGDGFDVKASAKLGVQGAVTITGHFVGNTPAVTADTPMTNIAVDFSRADTGTFAESTCTATYTSNNTYEGVAAGRVWADVECPTATNNSQGATCDGSATFKFENCATQ
ncbi:MAG: hypothetical protein ABI461_08535 [Polyangiaceae bacterium]